MPACCSVPCFAEVDSSKIGEFARQAAEKQENMGLDGRVLQNFCSKDAHQLAGPARHVPHFCAPYISQKKSGVLSQHGSPHGSQCVDVAR